MKVRELVDLYDNGIVEPTNIDLYYVASTCNLTYYEYITSTNDLLENGKVSEYNFYLDEPIYTFGIEPHQDHTLYVVIDRDFSSAD